jgi:hypothetical protein
MNTPVWNTMANVSVVLQSTALKSPNHTAAFLARATSLNPSLSPPKPFAEHMNSSEICGGNDYISIYQDTTFPTVNDSTIADYKPMGCYSEGTNGRSLAWRQDQLSTTNLTVEECLYACKDGGYSFAGVEYGQECYCGVVLGNGTVPLDSTSCNIKCTGNSAEYCGGRSTLNLYVASDLESTQPCNGGGSSSSSSSSTPPPTTSSSPPSTSSSPPTTSTTPTVSVVFLLDFSVGNTNIWTSRLQALLQRARPQHHQR